MVRKIIVFGNEKGGSGKSTAAVQVAIGYIQYFLNLPPSVVELHVAGATLLWSAALWLQLGYTAAAPAPSDAELRAVVDEVHNVRV